MDQEKENSTGEGSITSYESDYSVNLDHQNIQPHLSMPTIHPNLNRADFESSGSILAEGNQTQDEDENQDDSPQDGQKSGRRKTHRSRTLSSPLDQSKKKRSHGKYSLDSLQGSSLESKPGEKFDPTKRKLKVPKFGELSINEIYDSRKIKIESFPNIDRFSSLTSEQLNNLPWINYLSNSSSYNFIFPAGFRTRKISNVPGKCEYDSTTFEPDNDSIVSPQGFIIELDKPDKSEFESNPFIDLNAESEIKKRAFPFTLEESRMGYIHLKKLYIDASGGKVRCASAYAFVYADKPITETFLIQMDENVASTSFLCSKTAPNRIDSIVLPYPLNRQAYIVLFLLNEDQDMIFGLGRYTIPKKNVPETIQFEFTLPNSDMTLSSFLIGTPNASFIKFYADIEVLTSPIPEKTVRMTAFSDMFPSPLLTIYDLSIKLKPKAISKENRVLVSFKAQKIVPSDKKPPEPREIYGFLDLKTGQYTDTGYSISIDLNNSGSREGTYASQIVLTEPLHFLLDSTIPYPIEIVVSVHSLKKNGKLNLELTQKFQIKDQKQDHVMNMTAKGSILSKLTQGENQLRCSTLYPSIACPTEKIKPILSFDESTFTQEVFKDPMFKSISQYIIGKYLSVDYISRFDFTQLFDMLILGNMQDIQFWIDHFFYPDSGFVPIFVQRVIESFKVIKDWPQPFFSLIFKAMCCENKLYEKEINDLLTQALSSSYLAIQKSAGDLILQLPMFFDIKTCHSIVFHQIRQSETLTRFFLFKYLFSDVSFLQTLVYTDIKLPNKPMSPYIPILSLFFVTLNNAFIENNAESVGNAASTLTLLATTIERSFDEESSKHICMNLFPLFSIIFTFYDSLIEKLDNKIALIPIMLFIMKFSEKKQLLEYYGMLSSDNQLRFFEFLINLFNDSMIHTVIDSHNQLTTNSPLKERRKKKNKGIVTIMKTPEVEEESVESKKMTDLAQSAKTYNKYPLNCVYEVTGRYLNFLRHFQSFKAHSDEVQSLIIRLLQYLLIPLNQHHLAYQMIYKVLANYVTLFIDSFFNKKTTLVSQIIPDLVILSQRKGLNARAESIGFLLWLISKEIPYRKNADRCNIALQYGICNAVFYDSTDNYYPFWKFLPSIFDNIPSLFQRLNIALNDPLIERQVTQLLDIYLQFKNFPAIRARIYLKILDLNIERNRLISAFVTQWQLCALIAEVFKLQHIEIPGIPKNGSQGFPFIVNEPPVDLTNYEKDSAFLVMSSDLFSPLALQQAFEKALDLCQMAELDWLVGDVTQFLFEYLESVRNYTLLNKLYEKVAKSYTKLEKTKNQMFFFRRIFLKGKAASLLGYSDAIAMMSYEVYSTFVPWIYQVMTNVTPIRLDNGNPIFETSDDVYCQIVSVQTTDEAIRSLSAQEFTYDDVLNYTNWSDPMINRYTFITEVPLPSSIPTVKVKEHYTTPITVRDFFIEKLTKLKDDLQTETKALNDILPPPKMLQQWYSCINGASPGPLLDLMDRVFSCTKKIRQPYYGIVKDLCEYPSPVGDYINSPQLLQSTPNEIRKLCEDIWQLMVDAVEPLRLLMKLRVTSGDANEMAARQTNKVKYQEFRKRLRIPLVATTD